MADLYPLGLLPGERCTRAPRTQTPHASYPAACNPQKSRGEACLARPCLARPRLARPRLARPVPHTRLKPAELLLIDNRRVRHGRVGFDPSGAPREGTPTTPNWSLSAGVIQGIAWVSNPMPGRSPPYRRSFTFDSIGFNVGSSRLASQEAQPAKAVLMSFDP